MARIAHGVGTTIIATTPHNFPRSTLPIGEEARHRVALLQRAVNEEGIEISLKTGQEVRITRNLSAQVAAGDVASINGTRYVLTEPPFTSLPEYVEEELATLIANGFRPVLAHPERCRAIQNDPDIVHKLIRMGVLTQINTGSLLGHYGPQSLEAGVYLLRRQMAHVLATDAHGATGQRAPNMRSGYEAAALLVGEERALALTRDNPLAITEERDVPYRPSVESPDALPVESFALEAGPRRQLKLMTLACGRCGRRVFDPRDVVSPFTCEECRDSSTPLRFCNRCGRETATAELTASGRCDWCRTADDIPWEEEGE